LGSLLCSQERGFNRVLAVFVSLVVYGNLLFFAHFGQAGGKDKISKIRREIHGLLLGFLKRPRIGIERQSGTLCRVSFWTTLGKPRRNIEIKGKMRKKQKNFILRHPMRRKMKNLN